MRSQGHDAWHVKDIGLQHASDAAIWREATMRGAVIVSKDEDFATIIGRAQPGPQVVWLRIGKCSNEHLLARVAASWNGLLAELNAGVALVELR